MISLISTICLLVWVVSLQIAEKQNKNLKYHQDVISNYIGTSSWLQIGFLFLTIGLVLLGTVVDKGGVYFYVGSLGSLMVVLTRWKWDTKGTSKDWIHVVGAGFAFAVTTVGCLVSSYDNAPGLFGFALSIPIFSLLAFDLRFDNGDKERIVAYPLVLWVVISEVGKYFDLVHWTVF